MKKKPEEQVQESFSSAKDDDEISGIETSSVSQGNGNGIIEQPEVLSSRSSNGTLVRKREHPEESLAPSKRSKVCESTNSAEDGLKVTKTQLNANEKSLPLDKEFEEIKSKKEIDDDFENSVGYRSNGISKSYSPMDLVDLLSTKSDAELACITSDEKYEMETKLLNLMVRLRNLK